MAITAQGARHNMLWLFSVLLSLFERGSRSAEQHGVEEQLHRASRTKKTLGCLPVGWLG